MRVTRLTVVHAFPDERTRDRVLPFEDDQKYLAVPAAIDQDTTRELASLLGLPGRLSKAGRAVGIAAGVIGILGAVPTLGPAAAIGGGLITIVSAVWTGSVGRPPSQVKWLRWALEWDLERQASDAS